MSWQQLWMCFTSFALLRGQEHELFVIINILCWHLLGEQHVWNNLFVYNHNTLISHTVPVRTSLNSCWPFSTLSPSLTKNSPIIPAEGAVTGMLVWDKIKEWITMDSVCFGSNQLLKGHEPLQTRNKLIADKQVKHSPLVGSCKRNAI